MAPDKKNYHIAWILTHSDQQEVADAQLEETFDFCSSISHVTYRFGKIGKHLVVLASPASKTHHPSSDLIVRDLLKNAPSIRAGFLVSSNAVAPQTGPAFLGDVVVGLTLSDLQQSVTYLDADKTITQRRLFSTGKLGRVPTCVAEAVKAVTDPAVREEIFESSFQ